MVLCVDRDRIIFLGGKLHSPFFYYLKVKPITIFFYLGVFIALPAHTMAEEDQVDYSFEHLEEGIFLAFKKWVCFRRCGSHSAAKDEGFLCCKTFSGRW